MQPDIAKILVPALYPLQASFGLDPNEVPPEITVSGYIITPPDQLADPEEQRLSRFLLDNVPQVDPLYVFRMDVVRDLFYWWEDSAARPTDMLNLFGPTGTGKTSIIEQWCARLCMPLFSMKGHKKFEAYEAFGMMSFVDGNTQYVEGPMILAGRYGCPCIINEYDRVDPNKAIVFNDALQGGAYTVPGRNGETCSPRSGCRYIATSNTNLVEDVTSNYATAATQDPSLLERITALHVGYPVDDTEVRLVEAVLQPFEDELLAYWFDEEGIIVNTASGQKKGAAVSRHDFAVAMVELAKKIREQSKDCGNKSDAAIERTMSTRMLRKIAHHAVMHASAPSKRGQSALHLVMRKYLSNLATESTRLVLHQAIESIFNVKETITG